MRATSGFKTRLQQSTSNKRLTPTAQPILLVLRNSSKTSVSRIQIIPPLPSLVKNGIRMSPMPLRR